MTLWNEDEIDLLESFMRDPDNESVDYIAKITGRTPNAIKSKMQRIRDAEDVDWKLKPKWTKTQVNYLRSSLHYMTHKQIAEHLKKTPDAVKIKASKMGLHKNTFPNKKDKEIRDLASKGYTRTEIAKILGFSYDTILKYIWHNRIECTYTEVEVYTRKFREHERIRYLYDRGSLKR